MSTDRIDLEMVLKRIMAHVGSGFPNLKLRNRLLNLGLDEFVGKDGPASSAVLKYGFPFKFNNQLDEGILVLAHFLDRFKKEGGSLEIYAINKLSKGQEKDLSFWHDAKARLYLELQNIILLLDNTEFARIKTEKGEEPILRRSRIQRIFTFGELTDLAFLSQSGINVLGEQTAAKINVGFLFLKTFAGTSKIKPLSNTLVINYRPEKATPKRHDFFELYGFNDNTVRYDLPYKERCSARWFTRSELKKELNKKDSRLKQVVNLFTDSSDDFPKKPKQWAADFGNSSAICEFGQDTGEFFNDAMLMMFKAYLPVIGKSKKTDKGQTIINRINGAVTRDMIRLQRAMSSFGNAIEIKAVDATSTKNSLNVHESSPVYRDWLRRSLNRVLISTDKTLHRIYILDDDERDEDRDVEYQTLLRLMQFYRDYLHYEVSDMEEIVERHVATTQSSNSAKTNNRKWFREQWNTFSKRIGVFVTTSTVIAAFAQEVMRAKEYPAAFELLFKESKDKRLTTHYAELAKLDYLYARYERTPAQGGKTSEERMIYNFLNPRADTNELSFPAFTYRDSLSTPDENDRLFGFEGKGMGDWEGVQVQHRVNLLATSLLEYADIYDEILAETLKTEPHPALLSKLREELVTKRGDVTVPVQEILDARGVFEKRLYEYFKPHFDYLYAALEFMSVKVDFWKNVNALKVSEISPFQDCETKNADGEITVRGFTDWVMGEVRKRLEDSPHEMPDPEKFGLTPRSKSSIAIAQAKTFRHDVFISYKWANPIQEWVREKLHASLVAAGLRVVMDYDVEEGFGPGESVTLEMDRALEESAHTLAIISPEYFEAGSAEHEARLAHVQGLRGKQASLIPMIVVNTKMPLWISDYDPIDWTNSKNYAKQWQKLLKAVAAPNKEAPHPGPVSQGK